MEEQIEQKIAVLNDTPVIQNQEYVDKRVYTVNEVQDILGISPSTAYALIKQEHFHCIKVGRSIRVSKASFDAWLDGQLKEGA